MKLVVESESRRATNWWPLTVTWRTIAFSMHTPASAWRGHLGCAGRGSLGIRVRRRDRWWLEHRGHRDLSRLPVLHVVVDEEVEEALAHVPPDVGLITVEVEALASALLLLGRG
jgi:hypothetical protein